MSEAPQPKNHRRPVEGADGIWLQDSPENLMVINSVLSLDRMDLEEFRQLFEERVVGAGEGRRYPRFKRRIVSERGRPHWEDDPSFNISRHIMAAPEWIGTEADLQEYVSSLAHLPLPEDRSLWQIQVVAEFQDGTTALIVRIHHCMGDGLALIPVLFSLMDDSAAEKGFPGDRVAKKPQSRWALAAKLPVMGPLVLAQKLLLKRDSSPVHGPDLGGVKRVSWTRKFDLDQVKAIKDYFQATINDVLMACVGGAFQRYLGEVHDQVIPRVRASMPVSVRAKGDPPAMNNRFAAVLLELPVGVADIRERVAATKLRMDAMKRSVEPLVTYGLGRVLLKTMPHGLSRRLIDFLANKCTAVVTNVPGPQEPLFINGHRVRSMVFWVPQRAKIGIGISIFSFAGFVQVGVIADTRLIPEPGEFARAFEEELDQMKLLADGGGASDA